MTNQEAAEQFDIWFKGGEGLTTYVGGSVLAELQQQSRHARDPFLSEYAPVPKRTSTRRTARPRDPKPTKPLKYDAAMAEAVKALRADGLKLKTIAERLGMSVNAAWRLVMR